MREKLLKMLIENKQLNVYGKDIEVKTYLSETDKNGVNVYFSLYTINGCDEIDETINPENCINIIMEAFKEENKTIDRYDSEDVEISYEV